MASKSGYVSCACRDCFEIAIAGSAGRALCSLCKEAACDDEGRCECSAAIPELYDSESDDQPSDVVGGL